MRSSSPGSEVAMGAGEKAVGTAEGPAGFGVVNDAGYAEQPFRDPAAR